MKLWNSRNIYPTTRLAGCYYYNRQNFYVYFAGVGMSPDAGKSAKISLDIPFLQTAHITELVVTAGYEKQKQKKACGQNWKHIPQIMQYNVPPGSRGRETVSVVLH